MARRSKKTPGKAPTRRTSAAPKAKVSSAAVTAEQDPVEIVDAEIVEPAPEVIEAEPVSQEVALVKAPEPSSERGLTRADPLQRYMAEVNRHALLTREEEHTLALRYQATGDVDAAYRLVA